MQAVRIFGALLLLIFASQPGLAQSDTATNPALIPGGRYRLVPDHIQVVFSIMHLEISPYYGRFSGGTGTLNFDPLNPAASQVSVEFRTDSVSTPSEQLDRMLCEPSALDCAGFPRATFRSTAIERITDNTGDITGELTIRDVTRPVTLHAVFHGGRLGPLGGTGYVIGFSAETTIRRSDFGLDQMRWAFLVGDEVTLFITAEFIQDN